MKYMSNVLIIDDNADEASTLKKIFEERQCCPVAVNYTDIKEGFSLHPDIICCDIMLNTLGNNEQNFKTIAGLIKKIFNKCQEYIFIAWTSGDKKLFNELKQFIISDSSIPQPLGIYCFSKTNFSAEKLDKKIATIRKKHLGLDILQYWKKSVQESIENTISGICNLAKTKKNSIEDILKLLAYKTIGEHNLKNNEGKVLNFFLQYILRDYTEKLFYNQDNDIVKRISNLSVQKKTSLELMAVLNSALHIDNISFSTNLICPGSFYKINQNDLWGYLFGAKAMTDNSFSESKCEKKRLDILKTALKNTLKLKSDAQKKKRNKEINDIKDNVIWGIVDITADCDFSNKKEELNKCVLAFLTPLNKIHTEDKLSTSPNFLRYKITLNIDGNEQYFWLILCCKYLLGLRKELVLSNEFLFRIRETLLTCIRSNVFEHNSRIGTISF